MTGATARATVTATVAAIALAAANLASAQFWPELTDRQKKGRFRLGPLAFTPRLELRNAGVDTNVFVSPVDPTRDSSIVLRAATDVYLPVGRRVRLAGTGWLDFNYFASSSDQSSTDPGGQGRVELDAWRLTFVGGGGGFRSRQLYSTDIDERIERSEQWVNGGIRLRLTSQLRLEGGLESHEYRWNPTPEQDPAVKAQLDRDSRVWRGGLRYRLTPLTDFLASAERVEDTFLAAPAGLATTTSYRYLAGFEFREKAFLNGRFLGGIRDIPAREAGSVPPYTGPAFQASIGTRFLQRVRLSVSYDRDVYYSATGGFVDESPLRNTFTYSRLNGSLDVDSPLALVLRFTGGYEDAKYLRPYPVAGGTIDRRDQVCLLGFAILRRLGDSALFGVSAVHTHRDGNYPGGDYSRWQYGVQGYLNP